MADAEAARAGCSGKAPNSAVAACRVIIKDSGKRSRFSSRTFRWGLRDGPGSYGQSCRELGHEIIFQVAGY